jgi:site-specific DNA-methyltransferase (adenine-specific)
VAANLLGRRFLGIDQSEEFLNMSRARKEEIMDWRIAKAYQERLQKQAAICNNDGLGIMCEDEVEYGIVDLPF